MCVEEPKKGSCIKEKALLKKITETREKRKFTNFGQGVKLYLLKGKWLPF